MLKTNHQNKVDIGYIIITLIFCSLTLPFIFSDNRYWEHDHVQFHLPNILQIRENWPRLDLLKDSLSAISPGYHYFLATISFLTGKSELNLRIINNIIGLSIPLLAYYYVRKYVNIKVALLLVFPLALSNFLIKSSLWIGTDNPAFLLVFLTLILIFDSTDNLSNLQGLKIAFLSALTTFIRQLNVFLVAPSILNIILLEEESIKFKINKQKFLLIFVSLLPLLVIFILYTAWGGLVPPQWKSASVQFSFAPIAYILAYWGFIAPFYLSGIIKNIKEYINNKFIHFSFILGLLISLISKTTYSHEDGRWGGYIWTIVQKLPSIYDRSVFFIILAPLGSVFIAICCIKIKESVGLKKSILWLSSFLSWASTFIINRQIFPRYFETMILIFLIICLSYIWQDLSNNYHKIISISLFLLIIIQTIITVSLIF
ncbi:glycosyltransferase family 39 protein [Geminocystis sp. CENA526]|uniref:glycosyltransferase family 39 protein n=1 Tax=Geminocystis sp. CENA526 TaxID=1355871 RepID=UPI003D6FBBDA